MYNGDVDEQFYARRKDPTRVVGHSVYDFDDVSVQESYTINSYGEASADTSDVKPAFSALKSGSSYARQSLPMLHLGRELYTFPNCLVSPASSFHSSPESESFSDQNHSQANCSSAPYTDYPSPIDGTNFSESPADVVLAHQDALPYHYNEITSATFPPDETPSHPYIPIFYGGQVPPMHHEPQGLNDTSWYPVPEPRHPDIMIDDKRSLLKLMGLVEYNPNPAYISQLFTEKLIASTFGLSNGILGSKSLCGRPMKAKISSDAGKAASADRRKVPASFFCELRVACGASFTRKNGLINHYKAHLGITDKYCRFCSQAFTTSVGRHERKCKQNPDLCHQKSSPMCMMMSPQEYYGMIKTI